MKLIKLILALLPFMAVPANAQSLVVGDANGDGSLDISDVVTIVNRVLEGPPHFLSPLSRQQASSPHRPRSAIWHSVVMLQCGC